MLPPRYTQRSMTLTILTIADAVSPLLYDHFQSERWREVDFVLSAGDLSPDYLDFLCTALCVPVFYVRGNHDARYRREWYDGCINLHGRVMRHRGLVLAGFEGSQRYNQGACQYTERQMARLVRRVDWRSRLIGRPDIVLTHAPLAGCHDGADPCHRGFTCFRKATEAWGPAYWVHGHVHAYNRAPALSQIEGTTVVNAFPYRVIKIPEPIVQVQNRVSHVRHGERRRGFALGLVGRRDY